MIGYLALTIACFVLLEAFFSGSEMALVAANDKRLKLAADEGSAGARQALRLLERPSWLFATTQVGVQVCSVCNSVLSSAIILQLAGPGKEWLAVAVLGPLLLFFGQLLPKNVFRQHATRLAPRVAPIISAARYVFYPLVALGAAASRRAGGEAEGRSPYVTREEFRLLLAQDTAGEGGLGGPTVDLRAIERQLIVKMFSFTETAVREAMVPLIEVSAVSERATVAEALDVFRATPFSRLPVYRERVDNMVGVLHSFDLLGAPLDQSIARFRRPAYYLPETKRVDELLVELQRRRVHLAVVVDEYGGAVGIVTIEDLLEEIMGEIRDEFEQPQRRLTPLGNGRYLVSARIEIDELNERLAAGLPKDGYETLGGFILERLGRIPRPGETFREGRLIIAVRTVTERAIKEVELTVS